MSEANVEIAKGVIDAFNRRDYEKALHGFHADAVWHNTAEFPGQRICVGPEAIIDFWETLMESFEESGSRMDVERGSPTFGSWPGFVPRWPRSAPSGR